MSFRYIPIHSDLDRLDELVLLLNSHWKRSETARKTTVLQSCEDLPYYLMMIDNESNQLIGCCTMSKVIDDNSSNNNQSESILIENVLVRIEDRGKGYGSLILKELERIALNKGYRKCFLTTNDQKEFYIRNGYELCEPLAASKFNSVNEDVDRVNSLMRIFGGAGGKKKDENTGYWLNKNLF